MKRVVTILVVFVSFCVVHLTPALAIGGLDEGPPYEWTDVESGCEQYRCLLDHEKNVVETYSRSEWEQWEREINATGDCLGYDFGCAEEQMADRTDIEGPTFAQSNAAEDSVTALREEGTSLAPEAEKVWDAAGVDADTLPAQDSVADYLVSAGLEAPPAALAGGALLVGLAIGNGLDQLFHLPDLEEIIEEEEEASESAAAEAAAKVGGHINCTETAPTFTETHFETGPGSEVYFAEGVETKIEKFEPAGCYYISEAGTFGGPNGVQVESQEVGSASEGLLRPKRIEPLATPQPPPGFAGHWTYEEYLASESIYACPNKEALCFGIGGSFPVHDGRSYTRFKTLRFISESKPCELPGCLKPAGIPAPDIITPKIEQNNVKANLQPAPVYPHPATVPSKGPERIKEQKVKEITEVAPARKPLEEKAKPKEKEEEEEAKPLEIPIPQEDELATTYAAEVEAAGFTSPAPEIFPLKEASPNPEEGPADVGTVSPDPGSRAEPGTEVKIGENPADAVPPPSHGGIGGPTEPGFKFPSFPVLCKGFPFGVPCWLAKTIESWSTTAEAPVWGFHFEWEARRIEGSFNFAKLEPIMEKVRPAMVIFATVGLVLLFYSFAKGGGPPSGSGVSYENADLSDEGRAQGGGM